MQRWQFGLQRELWRNWMAEIRYVGNFGSQILTTRNLNALPNEYLSTSPTRDNTTNDFLTATVPNPFVGLMPPTAAATWRATTIARERLLRPYPHFDAVNTTTNEGESWYNAVQMRLDRRFANGYTLGVNYTYSRFEEATEFLNPARSGTLEGDLVRGHAAPALGQRARGTAVRPRAPLCSGRLACARCADRRLAVRSDLRVPERHFR